MSHGAFSFGVAENSDLTKFIFFGVGSIIMIFSGWRPDILFYILSYGRHDFEDVPKMPLLIFRIIALIFGTLTIFSLLVRFLLQYWSK